MFGCCDALFSVSCCLLMSRRQRQRLPLVAPLLLHRPQAGCFIQLASTPSSRRDRLLPRTGRLEGVPRRWTHTRRAARKVVCMSPALRNPVSGMSSRVLAMVPVSVTAVSRQGRSTSSQRELTPVVPARQRLPARAARSLRAQRVCATLENGSEQPSSARRQFLKIGSGAVLLSLLPQGAAWAEVSNTAYCAFTEIASGARSIRSGWNGSAQRLQRQ